MYMKKSVSLTKKDIIKILCEEKAKNDICKTDFVFNSYKDTVKEYFEEYIEPILIELDKQNILEYKPTEIRIGGETRRTYLKAMGYIKGTLYSADDEIYQLEGNEMYSNDFTIYGMDKFRLKTDDKGIFFLQSSDIKLKEEYANIIKRCFIIQSKIETYLINYIRPILPMIYSTNILKNVISKYNFDKEYLDFSIQVIFCDFIKIAYIQEEEEITKMLESDNEDDKRQLTRVLFNNFLINIEEELFVDGYKKYTFYYNNPNKYNHSDYNDYNKYISNIFDL